ncbi:hypothetical protein JCM8547_003450 [Rhodosporidiobolus lusitaniae]
MFGGSTSSGGRWSLGAKSYRAPTLGERERERRDRLVQEAERRKMHEIRHEEKHLRKTRELQREVERANARAIGMELGSRSPSLLGAGIGRSPRLRASSFSGVRTPSPLLGLGSPAIGGLGVGGVGGLGGLGRERRLSDAARRAGVAHGAELARVRAQRQSLEVEAARRERTASALRRERAELALANERILSSPHLSPALHGGIHHHHHGLGGLGVPGGAGLRRTRSWSGVPALGGSPLLGHVHSSPRIVPVPVPVHHHHSGTPRMNVSPRLLPLGVGGGGMSPRLRTLSGGLNHGLGGGGTPHIINYNTYNVEASPHLGHAHGHGMVGGLGAMDDLAHGGMQHSPMIDPLVLPGAATGAGMPGAFGGGGGMGMGMRQHGFVVTDLDYDEHGRQIIQPLGFVEGVSTPNPLLSEDDKLNQAIADLTQRAQAMGANAVLSVETGEDSVGGQIVVRGRAVMLG